MTATPPFTAAAHHLTAPRSIAWKTGAIAFAAAATLDVYAAYGDPQPNADQKSAVPFLIVIAAVVTVAVFARLVPNGLRAIAEHRGTATRWALTHSLVAVALVPLAFWSGLPVIIGAAGAVLGRQTRAQAATTRSARAALPLGILAVVACVAIVVASNVARA